MADQCHQILDELLKQDQEPFHLNAFIKQKRSQLRRSTSSRSFRDGTVLINIPSNTATLLVEAAERIQRRSKNPKTGFFGAFLKWVIAKDCKLSIGDHKGVVKSSCESNDFNKELLLDESCNSDFCTPEKRFFSNPFRFLLRRSTSWSGRCSPVTSPSHLVKREKEENQDKEQTSPVSVLETLLDGDSHGDESRELEDHETNVRRLKDKLLNRLRRFEKLAESNSIKLDQIESADSEDDQVSMGIVEESDDDDEPLSLYKKERAEAFVSELCFKPTQNHKSWETSQKNRETINMLFLGRFCKKRALWKKVESDKIEMVVELELKSGDNHMWRRLSEQIDDFAQEIELEMFDLLLDEILCQVLFCL